MPPCAPTLPLPSAGVWDPINCVWKDTLLPGGRVLPTPPPPPEPYPDMPPIGMNVIAAARSSSPLPQPPPEPYPDMPPIGMNVIAARPSSPRRYPLESRPNVVVAPPAPLAESVIPAAWQSAVHWVEGTSIGGVPTWIWLAAAAAGLLFFGGSQRRRHHT